jgi:transketolase
MWSERAARAALGMRRRAFEQTAKQQGGYLSQVCSTAELLATLYTRVLRLDESDAPLTPRPFPGHPTPRATQPPAGATYHGPTAPHLDRLIIGYPPYTLAVYSALTQLTRLDGKALDAYRADGGSLELWAGPHSPGFTFTAGPLGATLGLAAGVAMGRKLRGENGRVWALLDAHELRAGRAWEALGVLRARPLGNLAVLINAPYEEGGSPHVDAFVRACAPWRVDEIDGHDPEALDRASQRYDAEGPLLIRANTHPCQGMLYLSLAGLPLDFVRFKSTRDRMNFEASLRAELYRPGLAGDNR